MAQLPTLEENARKILDIFVNHFKCRPGSVLRGNNFIAVLHANGMTADDFNSGIQFASEAGWVEFPSSNSYKLTQVGFDAA